MITAKFFGVRKFRNLRVILLSGGSHHLPVPDSLPDADETDVSLITGKLRRLGEGGGDIETGTTLVLKEDNMVVANQAESASKFFH